jgi:hypothetical protein
MGSSSTIAALWTENCAKMPFLFNVPALDHLFGQELLLHG